MGVVEPTEVQREAIPKAMAGASLAIQCYTGSGKVFTYPLCKRFHVLGLKRLSESVACIHAFHMTVVWPGMQTLAYMLPVLSLALRKAEAEFEQLANVGKAHTAGVLHVVTLLHHVQVFHTLLR